MSVESVAIIGGTGALGGGLALRCARAGLKVTVGSRNAEKAREAARDIAGKTGSQLVTGAENSVAAAEGEIIFVTVPFASQADTLTAIREQCQGRIVVDTTVPLVPPKVARVQLPVQGSAAAIAAGILGSGVRLVSGFHNISATKLGMEGDPGCDVLIFGDEVEARETVVGLCGQIGVQAWHAGPLDNSVAAEAMTSVLISINKRYKVADGAGLRISGIGGK